MKPAIELQTDKGPAAVCSNYGDNGRFIIVCEHAGKQFPEAMACLGLGSEQVESHIAWDPGAEGVADRLAQKLEADLIAQRYSRLIYDCNRPPESWQAIREKSDNIVIPGNQNLSQDEKNWRIDNIYLPFKQKISDIVANRLAKGQQPIFITIHSFTPVYPGEKRDFHFGILHDSDSRMADILLSSRLPEAGLKVKRNEPYGPDDGVMHSLRQYAISNGLPNVMFEIRNDLIKTEEQQEHWAQMLSEMVIAASENLKTTSMN